MRVAIVADLHANARAVEAVDAALRDLAVDRLVCLGDIVGYNAEPAACVAWVRERVHTTVAGNHDVEIATAQASELLHSGGRRAQEWTRGQLGDDDLAYLDALPRVAVDASGLLAAHGCYLNDTYYVGYVTPTMVPENLDAIASRDGGPWIALCGHTHVPMVAWRHRGTAVTAPVDEPATWPGSADAVLLNPGSVGQPRDRDPRASFCVVDLERRRVDIHRVEYDAAAAAAANRRAGLPDALAARLLEGR